MKTTKEFIECVTEQLKQRIVSLEFKLHTEAMARRDMEYSINEELAKLKNAMVN